MEHINKLKEEKQKLNKKKRFKSNTLPALILTSPIVVWMSCFILLPILYVVAISFMQQGEYGGLNYTFTLENYKQVFSVVFLKVFGSTLMLSFWTTLFVLLLAYPLAYYIARKKEGKGAILVILVMIPFWTISLVRTNSWVIILQNKGIVNTLLLQLGLIHEPLKLLAKNGTVMLGTIYTMLPFAVLPLYSAIEKMDYCYIEAAKDLGSRPFKVFYSVILPLTFGGIFGSVILTFIPSLGIYFLADILGSGKSLYIGSLVRNQMLVTKNWPFGSALSVILIIITLLLLLIYTRFFKLDELEVG